MSEKLTGKTAAYFYFDGREAGEAIKCCHCGTLFNRRPGSGIVRGYCMKCSESTCGSEKCRECRPYKERFEKYMEGKILLTDL